MADTISDDFAMANGIAAYALVREMLLYFEALGVPRKSVVGIMRAAETKVKGFAEVKTHPALPIAADLLRSAAKQVEAMPHSSH